jgi:CheY-like chemotaxis protein
MEDKPNLFYFPTSIVFVDDDPDFIKSFTILLDEKLPIHLFSSTKEALAFINDQNSIVDSLNDFTNYTLLDNADQKVCLNIDALHKQIYNSERFAQISVVVTDYAMPEMDGVNFLSQIKHSEIKRILLTGVADEKIAVKAFNEGCLDHFYLKNTAELDKEINKTIKELQEKYFGILSDPIYFALSEHTGIFFSEPQFQQIFSKLKTDYNWSEYYILEQPQGILLLNSKGDASCLFVLSEEEMRSHYEIAVAEDAPAELLEILAEGKHISWFSTPDGYYAADSGLENWREFLYPADFFNGSKNNYHYALVSPSPLENIDMIKVRSYNDFLENFDREEISS